MQYSRILLKLSGESLSGKGSSGISDSVLEDYAQQINEIVKNGCEVAIVIGGGNIFRGLRGTESGFDRVKGDQMGMLATVINSLAIRKCHYTSGRKSKSIHINKNGTSWRTLQQGQCSRSYEE